ncbi:MAG: GNAT family N-acetyltransferase [Microvirga sp.]
MRAPQCWRPMAEGDLAAAMAVAAEVHPDYPESPAVFAERLRLYPEGCAVLADGPRIAGYRICHPWTPGSPPPLNTLIGRIPPRPATLLLHDLALTQDARGRGHARVIVEATVSLAAREGLPDVTLMAVAGTTPFWAGMGFREGGSRRPAPDRDGYGVGAMLMMRSIGTQA